MNRLTLVCKTCSFLCLTGLGAVSMVLIKSALAICSSGVLVLGCSPAMESYVSTPASVPFPHQPQNAEKLKVARRKRRTNVSDLQQDPLAACPNRPNAIRALQCKAAKGASCFFGFGGKIVLPLKGGGSRHSLHFSPLALSTLGTALSRVAIASSECGVERWRLRPTSFLRTVDHRKGTGAWHPRIGLRLRERSGPLPCLKPASRITDRRQLLPPRRRHRQWQSCNLLSPLTSRR